jgi:hypothetical protein
MDASAKIKPAGDEFRPATPEEMPDDAALSLRDNVVALMIADACQIMPSIRQLSMAGVSPFAVHRSLLRVHAIMLRAGLRLGAIRIDDCPTVGNA